MNNLKQILTNYEAILFDAYGVLVNSEQALPHANEVLSYLKSINKPYYLLTNDSSKTAITASTKYLKFGLDINPEQIISSGSLLTDYFAEHNLQGKRCLVLGPADSFNFITEAGGKLVNINEDFEVLVICDETGYPFLETIDQVISLLFQKFDRQEQVELILPNPDLIFSKSESQFGLASGSIALIIEEALKIRFGKNTLHQFVKLGKPYNRIFAAAFKKTSTMKMLMIGDQMETDIKGAHSFGIDSLLLSGGVTNLELKQLDFKPTYVLENLAL
ncbi:MAG: HAD-IA family hydrolase [Proteobacteria bacterium]|nr:HAD-IA family hydrolase [Pseudomonadota bacterium]